MNAMGVCVLGFSFRSLSWWIVRCYKKGGQICGHLSITVCQFPEEGGRGKDKLDQCHKGCWGMRTLNPFHEMEIRLYCGGIHMIRLV